MFQAIRLPDVRSQSFHVYAGRWSMGGGTPPSPSKADKVFIANDIGPDLCARQYRRSADSGFGLASLLGGVVKTSMFSFPSRWFLLN
jgi:hypothetical protein